MAILFNKHRVKMTSICSVIALMAFVTPAYADDAKIMAQLQKMQEQIEAQNTKINQLQSELKSAKSSGGQSSRMSEEDISDIAAEVVEDRLDTFAEENKPKIEVSGYTTSQYSGSNKDGAMDRQVFNSPETRLVFQGRANRNWAALLEIEMSNAFEIGTSSGSNSMAGDISLERAYVEYNHNKQLNARAGKFFTPLGLWAQEHWAISVDSINNPIFLRNDYFNITQVGVEGFGSWSPDSEDSLLSSIDYSVFVTNGEQADGTSTATTGSLGYGTRVATTFADKYTFGMSASTYKDPNRVVGSNNVPGVVNYIPFARFKLPHGVTLNGEFIHQKWDEGVSNRDAWYASAKWQFHPKVYAYYRYDKGNAPKSGAGDSDVEQANTFTLGYWPLPNVRTKFEVSTYSFDDPTSEDYEMGTAWIGFIF